MRAAFFRQPENRYNSAYFVAVRMPNKESEMRANLVPYASSPQWRKPDFPKDLFEPHGYPEQTWVHYEVLAGSLKLLELDDKGTVAEEYALTPESEPFTARPDAAYRLAQASDDACLRLHYLCEPAHFFQIRHGMTPAHSEVVAAVEKFGIAPCKTLDMGAGQGRNALYLALKGFDVTAVDINAGALANAAQVAAQENLPVATELYDLNLAALHDDYGFIVSTVTMMFLERDRIPAVIADMQAHTVAGGCNLIVCAMDTPDCPCPRNFAFTFGEGELARYYAGWELLDYREEIGSMHARDANGNPVQFKFAHLLARKP